MVRSSRDQLIAALGNPAGPDLSLTRYPATTEQAFDTARFLADRPVVAVHFHPPTARSSVRARSASSSTTLLLREGLALDRRPGNRRMGR